ncbi:hypothetical protein CK203_041694 [Vitis vinifera]|uniref:Mitochondrial protein n=1 Tax=Vitis vinifera TaxID=29760 RepID=A0A438HCX5_VITVI|nr:hypothetical protein CK203_041694 [Vitis vinifera]
MVLVLNGFSEQRSKMMGLLIGLKLALLLITCNWAIHQLDVKNASPWSLAGNHLYEATFEIAQFFWGWRCTVFEGACCYCQQSILGDILLQYKMLDIAYMMSQMAIKNSSSSDDSPLAYATEYGRLVGALQYLTFTRPDITHVVNQVCQHFRSLTTQHLREVKHILWYPQRYT